MKKTFDDTFNELDDLLIVLQDTTEITSANEKQEPWTSIAEIYKSANSAKKKAVTSVLNAILTHKRVFFGLSRDNIAKLTREDRNHSPQSGFSNETYKFIRLFLQRKYIRRIHEGSHLKRSVDIFEVIDPEILKYLNCTDLDRQKDEAISFCQRSDKKSDVGSSKEKKNQEEKAETSSLPDSAFKEIMDYFEINLLNSCNTLRSTKRLDITWSFEFTKKIKGCNNASLKMILNRIKELKKYNDCDEVKIILKEIQPTLRPIFLPVL